MAALTGGPARAQKPAWPGAGFIPAALNDLCPFFDFLTMYFLNAAGDVGLDLHPVWPAALPWWIGQNDVDSHVELFDQVCWGFFGANSPIVGTYGSSLARLPDCSDLNFVSIELRKLTKAFADQRRRKG